MRFGPLPIELVEGKILGHNIAREDGRRTLRKGKPLTAVDIQTLRQLGRDIVYVAELEAGDVSENEAAARVARAVTGPGLHFSGPATGRVNLRSNGLGVLRVDADRLAQLNVSAGITLATLATYTAVSPNKMVATVKIIPYAVPETAVAKVECIANDGGPLIRIAPLLPRRVDVIYSGSTFAQARIIKSFGPPLQARIQSFGSTIATTAFIPLEDEQGEIELAAMLQHRVANGTELIILAGETAIMDRYDIAPRAVERAGGEITCFGAPVDPGNLLLLGYIGDTPIIGAPGCVRSPKTNIIDYVLPRLLVGDRLTQDDIVGWGHGGLLEDIQERPLPRRKIEQ